MAILTTAEKARLIVRNPVSLAEIPANLVDGFVTVGDSAVAVVQAQGGQLYVIPVGPGATTVDVALPDGQSGTLALEVEFAPLIVELAAPEPR